MTNKKFCYSLLLFATLIFGVDIKATEKSCQFIPSDQNLMDGKLSDNWAQELIGSDLLREELENIPPPNKRNWLSIGDSITDLHMVGVKNLISNNNPYTGLPLLEKESIPIYMTSYKDQHIKLEEHFNGTSLPSFYHHGLITTYHDHDVTKIVHDFLSRLSSSTIIVTPAGNNYPMKINNVRINLGKEKKIIVVGSLSPKGFVSSFSQSGEAILILAPSDSYLASSDSWGEYRLFGGTSGAAPLVTMGLGGFEWASGYHPTTYEAQVLLTKTAVATVHSHERPRHNGVGMLNSYKLGMVGKRLREKCQDQSSPKKCFQRGILREASYNFYSQSEQEDLQMDLARSFPECFPKSQTSNVVDTETVQQERRYALMDILAEKLDNDIFKKERFTFFSWLDQRLSPELAQFGSEMATQITTSIKEYMLIAFYQHFYSSSLSTISASLSNSKGHEETSAALCKLVGHSLQEAFQVALEQISAPKDDIPSLVQRIFPTGGESICQNFYQSDIKVVLDNAEKNVDAHASCSRQQRTFNKLRRITLLNPGQKDLWKSLSCIYKQQGFSVNSQGIDNITLALEPVDKMAQSLFRGDIDSRKALVRILPFLGERESLREIENSVFLDSDLHEELSKALYQYYQSKDPKETLKELKYVFPDIGTHTSRLIFKFSIDTFTSEDISFLARSSLIEKDYLADIFIMAGEKRIPLLKELLHHPDIEVQKKAVISIANAASDQALEALIPLLTPNTGPVVRKTIAYALIKFGDKGTEVAQGIVQNDPDDEVRAYAASTEYRLTGSDESLRLFYENSDATTKQHLYNAYFSHYGQVITHLDYLERTIPAPRRSAYFLELIITDSHADYTLRSLAIETMIDTNIKRAIPLLQEIMTSDPDAYMQRMALTYLYLLEKHVDDRYFQTGMAP